MVNRDKFKGTKGEFDALVRMVNRINQRVKQLQRMGYEVSEVSQNAELYNDPEKLRKLFTKYEEVINPDYVNELHKSTIRIMENNLNKLFGEDIKVDFSPQQLKDFITKYPEYASLVKLSPNKAKEELDKVMDILGGSKEGIKNAIADILNAKPQPATTKRPKFKKKRHK